MKEKETYKKASEILKRFASEAELPVQKESIKQMQQQMNAFTPPQTSQLQANTPPFMTAQTVLNTNRQQPNGASIKQLGSSNNNNMIAAQASRNHQPMPNSNIVTPVAASQNINPMPTFSNPQANMYAYAERMQRTLIPRAFVPQNRSTIDKVLDFFIGDGPNNR